MRRNKKPSTTVLAIGDWKDYDSYRKISRERRFFRSRGFRFVSVRYQRVLAGRLPRIPTDRVVVFLFFPMVYWNRRIEHPGYKGVYGDRRFYRMFYRFWKTAKAKLDKALKAKRVVYINDPMYCVYYRDKKRVISRLLRRGILQPKNYHPISIPRIRKILSRSQSLYVKMRYGSMGKGITYLSSVTWQTNFIFRNGRIHSRRADHGWKFRDVTGNTRFLKALIKHDVLVEEGIEPLIVDGAMMDLRVYVFMGKAIYVYPRLNEPHRLTTNISQGGRGDPAMLKRIPKKAIRRIQAVAVKATKAANLRFAGADVIPSRDFKKAYLIDLNVFPGFPARKTFNMSRQLALELEKRMAP